MTFLLVCFMHTHTHTHLQVIKEQIPEALMECAQIHGMGIIFSQSQIKTMTCRCDGALPNRRQLYLLIAQIVSRSGSCQENLGYRWRHHVTHPLPLSDLKHAKGMPDAPQAQATELQSYRLSAWELQMI